MRQALSKDFAANFNEETELVALVKGVFGVRNAILNLLQLKEPIYIYGIQSSKVLEIFGEDFFKDFHTRRINNNIPARFIFNDKDDLAFQRSAMPLTEARYVKKIQNTQVLIVIISNRVLNILLEDHPSAIEIRNNSVADAYRNYFFLLWNSSHKLS